MKILIERKRHSFVIGALCGVFIALFIWQKDVSSEIEHRMAQLNGLDFSNFDVQSAIAEFLPSSVTDLFSEDELPGVVLRREGVRPHYPVVLIPGFVSSGLEIWRAKDGCFHGKFRSRVWGTVSMIQSMLLQTDCWLRHVSLHPVKGTDPVGVSVRASSGFDAADFLVGGYWVWARLLENLALLGYDSNSMVFAAHDWRVSPMVLEKRDRYFTKTTRDIEEMVESLGRKVVIVTHSYGAQLVHYMFKWVESKNGANRGKDWTNKHIHAVVNIAGGLLGVPKALTAWLSGEMKDTADLGHMENIFMRDRFSAGSRRALFRTWSSVSSLFPLGGNRIWGNHLWSPEEAIYPMNDKISDKGSWINFVNPHSIEKSNYYQSPVSNENPKTNISPFELYQQDFIDNQNSAFAPHNLFRSNWTIEESIEFCLLDTDSERRAVVREEMEWLHAVDAGANPEKYDEPKYWLNPLTAPLPYAPDTSYYALYGSGLPTERNLFYRTTEHAFSSDGVVKHVDISIANKLENQLHTQSDDPFGFRFGPEPRILIDKSFEMSEHKVSFGTGTVDGDGTVPILSTLLVPRWIWRKGSDFNPGGSNVISRGYEHQKGTILSPRGTKSSDHVDIMGNYDVLRDVLLICAGEEKDKVVNRVSPKHDHMIKRINFKTDYILNPETPNEPDLTITWEDLKNYEDYRESLENSSGSSSRDEL